MMNRKDNLMAIYHHQSHDHIASFFDIASVGGDAEEFENGPAGGAGGPANAPLGGGGSSVTARRPAWRLGSPRRSRGPSRP